MKIDREIVDGEEIARVTFRHLNAACFFLVIWLAGWTFGCWKIVSDIVNKPFNFTECLFAIPFLLAWAVVACIIAVMLFGRTAITFSRAGVTRFTGIGSVGYRKSFEILPGYALGTDEIEVPTKHGHATKYRLVISTPFDLDGPRVVYTSSDADLVHELFKAGDAVVGGGAPATARDGAAGAAEDEQERRDRELLSGRPPRGLSVTRDFEGRVTVSMRHVSLLPAIPPAVAAAAFGAFAWTKRGVLPAPVLAIAGVSVLVALLQLVYAFFGKRTVTLDHGEGATFVGVCGIGRRERFKYGARGDSALPSRLCAAWPKDVQPYLAALLRHPESAPATMPM